MGRLKLTFPYVVLAGVVVVVLWSNMPRAGSGEVAPTAHIAMCPSCGMEVDPAEALTAQVNGRAQYFCSAGCQDRFVRRSAKRSPPGASERIVDVVCNMEVNPAWGITSEYAGRTYYFCVDRCRERFDENPEQYLAVKCAVCQSPIAGRAAFPATYLGKTYELCSAEHRDTFKKDPASFFLHTMWGLPEWLYYASIAIVLVVSFGLFDRLDRRSAAAHLDVTSVAVREGVAYPAETRRDRIGGESDLAAECAAGTALTTVSSAAVSATAAPTVDAALTRPAAAPKASRSVRPHGTSTVGAGVVPVAAAVDPTRFDLLSIGLINRAARSRVFRFALQAVVTVLFLLIVAAGLFGNQNPSLNIAPLLTWTVWWGLLIVLILYAGKAWCYVCPWDALAGWAEKLALWRKSDDGLSFGWRWPRVVRNISIATILFVGLTWIELGFGVTMKPRVTAYLAIGMLLMAVVSALLFDRKSFCRYGCLVGRVSGLYALFGGTEVRPRDEGRCRSCGTKECVKGSETAYGCPTFLYPGRLRVNTYCIQCMECIQACPHDNMAVNLRPWGSDLAGEGKPRADEAYLALLMLAITGFHGLTMTPVWAQFVSAIRGAAGAGRIAGFSAGMALLMFGPVAVYAVLVAASKSLVGGDAPRKLSYYDYFIRYAYALLPIALFYHIAHNLEHLLMEGPKIIALVSDPFGWGWNVFGTAHWVVPPLISLDKLWLVQASLVLIGHVYSLWVAQRTSLRLFGSSRAALRSQLPMLAGMICFSVFSLWLLKQPMEMRTSAM